MWMRSSVRAGNLYSQRVRVSCAKSVRARCVACTREARASVGVSFHGDRTRARERAKIIVNGFLVVQRAGLFIQTCSDSVIYTML